MTIISRDFKGIWIPREIWLRTDLTCQEKSLWAEIHSLYDREKGGCYASNEYLEEFCGVKERRLQEMFLNLKEKGLLIQVSFNGRQRVLKAIDPKEEESLCVSDPHNNAGQRCAKVRVSGAVECGSPNIYREKEITKNNNKEKPVVVPSFIKEIKDLSDEEKKSLSKFPEERVKLAIEFNRKEKPTHSKIQQMIWHCKQEIPPKPSAKSKKNDLHDYCLNYFKSKTSKTCEVIITKECIYFTPTEGADQTPRDIKFNEESATEKISRWCEHYKFK